MKKIRWIFITLFIALFSNVQSESLSNWQIISYMNQGHVDGCAITIDTCIYALGGYWSYNSTVERAFVNPDGSLTAWEFMNPMSRNRDGAGAVIWNNRIYVMSGTSVESATINSDYSLSTWTVISSLPYRHWHSAVVWNSNIYIIGGIDSTYYDTTTVLRSHINPDGSLTSWETLSTRLNIHREEFAAVVWNGYIYAMGGAGFTPPYVAETVERAEILPDGSLGPWTLETARLTQSGSYAPIDFGGVVSNNYIYVLGGLGESVHGGPLPSRRVLRAPILPDGHLGAWQDMSPMVQLREHLSSVCIGNRYIYAIDGYDNSVEMAEIFPTEVNDSQWQLYE